jgi:APA family basic amino acid/polyamine antiporter
MGATMQTDHSEAKIGLLALSCLVISAQLGASIFFMPAQIAQFRTCGLFGWILGGTGAILLTLVFSFLCIRTSRVGGPHVYARMFFGKKVGFFVTWIYWCGAWACNPIIIAVSINYLMSLTGPLDPSTKLCLEILLVMSLTFINILGLKTSSAVEVILTILKILPLVVVPLIALPAINLEHFNELTPSGMSMSDTIIKATMFSFWAFVGLEGGTSPAEVVRNPKRTIPLAIVLGTAFVALISIVNTIAAYGIISPAELEKEGAPFSKMLLLLFDGYSFDKIIGIVTFLMCYGSLNAWVFFSGQIARSAATEGIFPDSFKKLNKNGVPARALWISAAGTIAILFLQKLPMFGDKIAKFVDMSVIIYITLYLMSVIAYIKFMCKSKNNALLQIVVTALALIFCSFILYHSDLFDFSALIIMLLSGIPVYLRLRKNEKSDNLPI